ncbi:MAG: hypothetical protein ABFD25_21135 [Clostridiaceae bacterium]
MKDINLLLEEEKRIQQEGVTVNEPARPAGKIIVTVLTAALGLTTLIGPKLYAGSMELKLASVQEQLKSEKYQEVMSVKSQLVIEDKQLNDKKSIIEYIDEQAYPVNDILNTIRNNTPKGCTINDIQYDTHTLRLGVRVEEIYNVAEFLLNMDRLENIRLSENSNTIKMNANGDYAFNFEVGQREGE